MYHWLDLPEAVRRNVENRCGQVLNTKLIAGGQNSQLTLILETLTARTFLKGVRTDNPRAVWTQNNERCINPYVLRITPRLLWHLQEDGWDLLLFEHTAGRHADLSPGSPDLPKIAQTLEALSAIPCPDIELKPIEHRWCEYDERAPILAGHSLLHTDLNPRNILTDAAAQLVDWAWPTRGAAWIDPACLVLHMIAAGHQPVEAEAWARALSSWADANDDAIEVFLNINIRMWEQITMADPQPWKTAVARAATTWASYRDNHLRNF